MTLQMVQPYRVVMLLWI